MDQRLKRKLLMFQIAGWINLALGLYVLIQGPGFLPQSTVFWLTLFFFAFAAVDFWFPRMLRKRWQEMLEKHVAEQQAKAKDEGGRIKAEG
jgi:hypothetical protein